MAVHSPPVVAEAVIEVCHEEGRWLIRSSDHLFSGMFVDLRSAQRHAEAEAQAHPGHVVIIRACPKA